MSIRINLLAEAQAIEELRRRDPLKRAIWMGVFLVGLMLAWSSSLQLKAIIARGDVNRVEAQLSARTNEFQLVLSNEKKLNEIVNKLAALQQLATNRLLYGTLLNALQQTTIDDVQLMRLRTDQSYYLTEEVKPKTNGTRIVLGRAATVAEKIVLTLDAKDSGANPGDQVNQFKRAVAECPYFQSLLGKTNEVRLTSLSPPQSIDNRSFVLFTLECRYPERIR